MKALDKAAKDKSETAEEKYLRMLKEYPQIIQRVPHYDVAVAPNFEIEIESNGIYKLIDDGYIVAPFADIGQLCKFILS